MACTLHEALEKYDLYARARGFSPATIDHTRRSVTLFDDFLGGQKDVADITRLDFRHFLADLRERPNRNLGRSGKTRKLSGTSINTYARAIRAFFSWLNAEGLNAANPLESEPPPRKPRTLPKVYSEAELRAFFTKVTGSLRNKAIVFTFLDPGLRLSELAGLDLDRVDTAGRVAKVMGKGNKERLVPLPPEAAAAIDDYINGGRPVPKDTNRLFLTDAGTPFSAAGMQSMLARLGNEAGVAERLSPHKLRHTCATEGLRYGGNLEYIKIILGHSDIKTTSNAYLNVDFKDVKAAHEKFSPLSNLMHGQEPENTGTLHRTAARRSRWEASKAIPEGALPQAPKKSRVKRKGVPLRTAQQRRTGADRTARPPDRVAPPLDELYKRHLSRLAVLAGNLADDIEQGRMEEPRQPTRTPSGGAFAGVDLNRLFHAQSVFHSQNDRLWPYLSQHLDHEFPSPRLTLEIARLGIAAFVDRLRRGAPKERRLAEQVRERLVLISERGTFEGTCEICRRYFRSLGRPEGDAGGCDA